MRKFGLMVSLVVVVMMTVVLTGFTTAGNHVTPVISDVHVTEASTSPRYEIRGTYAQIRGACGSVEEKANRAIQDVVQDEIRSFKADEADRVADLARSGDELKGTSVADGTSELDISSAVETATSDLLSLRLTFSCYHAGCAHGMTVTRVVNYDLAHGVLLTRTALFKNGPAALKFISEYARTELDRNSLSADERSWINEGTDPANAENLRNLVLTPTGLIVIFDQYDVDCYAAGQKEVRIPLSIINPLLAVTPLNNRRC